MSKSKVKMFFLPAVVGISHTAPLVNAARFFASHPDVQVTIVTTQKNAQIFGKDVTDDCEIRGHDIKFHIVKIPTSQVGLADEDVDKIMTSPTLENMGKLFRAVNLLSGTVLDLVRAGQADCLVSDLVNPWAAKVASEVDIPFITFTRASLFAVCVDHSLTRFKPHESVSSDTEPFVVTGLPDKVELTRSRLPGYVEDQGIARELRLSAQHALDTSYCMIFNTFADLEFKYAEYCNNVIGRKCCLVGPVHCCPSIKSLQEKGDNNSVLQWLDKRPVKSVLYVSFGSYAPMCKEQFHEIAYGLEASGHSFIWVARAQDEQGWFPKGFESRIRDSDQGLVLRTWAPQELILGHTSLGAFMTHCGWNSCLETLANGVPVITWPLGVEQFENECFMVDVLQVGFPVGNEEWTSQHEELKVTVTRDKVEVAVRRMMDNETEEVLAMRKRAQEFAEKSKAAVQEGGSSYRDVYALVETLKARQVSA